MKVRDVLVAQMRVLGSSSANTVLRLVKASQLGLSLSRKINSKSVFIEPEKYLLWLCCRITLKYCSFL